MTCWRRSKTFPHGRRGPDEAGINEAIRSGLQNPATLAVERFKDKNYLRKEEARGPSDFEGSGSPLRRRYDGQVKCFCR